ncbi:MAG: MarR family winged helix-turn-helix transcriptional regulator [Thermoplasmatota archaeon]
MSEDKSIHKLLHKVYKKTMMEFKQKLEPYDFTRGEFPFLIGLLRNGDGVTQKEICEKIPISKSTTSKMVNNLIDKGYLRKEKDKEDRRANRIYFTEKKEEIENIVKELDEKAEEMMLKDFEDEEKEQLKKFLIRILNNIEDE